jgi:hypothetical protein
MGREIKRVPIEFDWPLEKIWTGYIRPERLHEKQCAACEGSGYSPQAKHLHERWYGYVPFDPAETGSEPFTIETPEVRALAERNVASSPGFYGQGDPAIFAEARRLARLWNRAWSHHLAQEDVDALIAGDRLRDFTHTWTKANGWQPKDPEHVVTAAEVNRWSIVGFGHDSISCHIVIKAKCERDGVSHLCAECGGEGYIERWKGQRAMADAWEQTEPPAGEGWQLWETVSEGSPISPVFATAEQLVDYLVELGDVWGQKRGEKWSRESAEAFVRAGWAPSLMVDASGAHEPEDTPASSGI